jgi:broad specificity phosphatase PhoE
MAIHLIRHGETDWNRTQRLQGIQDVPLNRRGAVQAWRLAGRFRDLRLSAVFCSPLDRARSTGLVISKCQHCPVVIEDDLREIDHGSWTGMRISTVARKFPDAHAVWRWSPDRYVPSTGEALQEVYRRSSGVLLRIIKLGLSGDVLVVSHGVINALLICAALDLGISRVWGCSQPNGGVTVFRLRGPCVAAVEDLDDA